MATVLDVTVNPAGDLILKFEIEPGRSPEVDSVANALAAWVDVLETAASIVDPESRLIVELAGVEAGSQMFKMLLRRAEEAARQVKKGSSEYPLISQAAIALGGMVVAGTIGSVATIALQPDPRIPSDQMDVFEQMGRDLRESTEMQKKNTEFYGILQDEPAFQELKILGGPSRVPLYSVPRSEFATRSGIWADDDEQLTPILESRTAVWDVILIKPALIAEERRWTFAKDGLEFTALMTDKAVLNAIHDKTLPIRIAEGVAMKIEVVYRERRDGDAWLPVPGSRKVKRVLSPLPPTSSGPLFTAGSP